MRKATWLIFLMMALGACWLYWETSVVSTEQVSIPITDLPEQLVGTKIVHLSDLHGRAIPPNGRAYQAIAKAEPHLIAITGDIIDHSIACLDDILPFLSNLPAIAPTFVVSGNHDYNADFEKLASRLEAAGITVLENENVILRVNDTDFTLVGVCDPFTGRHNLTQSMASVSGRPIILLAHAHTILEQAREKAIMGSVNDAQLLAKVDLLLTGHTHGGQIKLPYLGAVTTATGQLFPKQHIQGLSWEETGWLYISRGLGQTGLVKLRFLSRPEVTVLTLQRR